MKAQDGGEIEHIVSELSLTKNKIMTKAFTYI